MGNKQGSLGHRLETASKTGVLALPDKKLEEFPDDLNKIAAILRNLDLSNNRITTIPSSIGNFKLLKSLNLAGNRLSKIPTSVGDLLKLETLVLSRNHLTELPDSIEALKNLKNLNLSDNRLESFPLVLCKLQKLDVADLSNNKLTSLPEDDELINLQTTELNLNQNQIKAVPKVMAGCPRLKTLRLEENCLSLEAIPVEILTDSVTSTLCTRGNLFTEKQLSEVEGYSRYLERFTAVKRKLD